MFVDVNVMNDVFVLVMYNVMPSALFIPTTMASSNLS